MKSLVFFVSLIISAFTAIGQVSNYTDVFVHKPFFEELNNAKDAIEIEIEGTPYLDSTYSNGEFLIRNTRYSLPMRYNIFLEAFEVILDQNIVFINSNLADSVFYKDTPFVFKKIGTRKNVFQLLYNNNNVDFLKKYSIIFFEGSSGVPFKEDIIPHYKLKVPEYYFCSKENRLTRINGFSDFIDLKPDSKKTIKEFIKKNGLKKNREKDLITLFNYTMGL